MHTEPSEFTTDFFISRSGDYGETAQEVARVLRSAGYTAEYQDEDIPVGANFIDIMHSLLKRCRHMVALISQSYEKSPYCNAEWTNFYARSDQTGRRLIPIRVDGVEPDGLFRSIVYADLVGVSDPTERERTILDAAVGRGKGPAPRYYVFANVPDRNRLFTGRNKRVETIREIFFGGNDDTKVHGNICALAGIGGVGKSSLACEYAHRTQPQYAGVWWAYAESRETLLSSLADLASAMGTATRSFSDMKEAANHAFSQLQRSSLPWLLIFDNVQSPDDVRGLIPRTGAHVLITSKWPEWRNTAHEILLDVFSNRIASLFLLDQTGQTDKKAAEQLANSLGCLPLALDHAASVCRRTGMDFRTYSNKLEDLVAHVPRGAAYPKSVGASVELSLNEAIGRCSYSEEAIEIISFFGSEGIPTRILDTDQLDILNKADAIAALAEVSLVKIENRLGKSTISVHRLVQLVVRKRLQNKGQFDRMASIAISLMLKYFPDSTKQIDPNCWSEASELLPHVLTVLDVAPESIRSQIETVQLMDDTGRYLVSRASFSEAEQLFQSALHAFEALELRQSPKASKMLVSLALVMNETGQFEEAETFAREAIDVIPTDENSPEENLADALTVLGRVLRSRKQTIEAESCYRKALSMYERKRGSDHHQYASGLNNLALLFSETGRLIEAEPLFMQALKLFRSNLGLEHPDVARATHNLADLMAELGEHEKAEQLFLDALAVSERTLGRDHPDVATTLHNLARSHHALGKTESAELGFRRALDIYESNYDANHPFVATAKASLMRVSTSS